LVFSERVAALRISVIASALLLLFLSADVRSQDVEEQSIDNEAEASGVEAAEPATEAEPEPEPEEEPVEIDETGLDEQGFSNEDDDFAPSEDIPTDQSIDFPADI
jgi:hypothetical protein